MEIQAIKDRLKPGARVHMVGVGGISMAPLAQVLLQLGLQVSGSDRRDGPALEQLRRLGAVIFIGEDAGHVPGADLLIRTAAAADDNPEVAAARAQGIPVFERAQGWGALMDGYPNALCVAGTHGKTTTTAMCTHIAMAAGADPTVMLGGRLPLLNGCHRMGHGDTIILEACEYCNSYHAFRPTIAVILDIEADHLDFFKTFENVCLSFRQFAQLVPPAGRLIYNAEDEAAVKTLDGLACPRLSFGLEQGDVTCAGLEFPGGLPRFEVLCQGKHYARITLNVPGVYNVKNALAACAAAIALGWEGRFAQAGLSAFHGVGRRFEFKGRFHGAEIYDDYAHHPGELHALLEGVKKLGYRRIVCAFQPHTHHRTQALFSDFVRELQAADVVVLAEIYTAREDGVPISSRQLAAEIPGAYCCGSTEETAALLARLAQPGDLILTVGAGDIYKAGEALAAMGAAQ